MSLLLILALKGALILALASGAVALLRNAPAAARHGIWVAAFIALLALPLLATVGPAWELGILPQSLTDPAPLAPEAASSFAPLAPVSPGTPVGVQPFAMEPPAPPTAPLAPEGFSPEAGMAETPFAPREAGLWASFVALGPAQIALSIWGVGLGLVLMGWAATLFAAWLFVRRATPEADEAWQDAFERARMLSDIDRPVRLLRSDALDVPVAWGLREPAVVLPADADEWDEDRREAVLLHELAHIRRRDARTQLLAQVAVAVHWFDPLAWWAYRRFLIEREHACDDAVLRGGAKPSAYAGHLVEIARRIKRERLALAGLSPMARKSCLEGRVLSILAERRRESMSIVTSTVLGLVACALVLPLAACQLTANAAEADTYQASKPMARIHVVADHEEADDHDQWEMLEEDMADVEASLAELALDTIPDAETILGPALQSALASVRDLRQRGINLSDSEWAEIEAEIEEAFGDAREDYDEAIEDALLEMDGDDWRNDMRRAMREAEETRYSVMAEVNSAMATARRETREALRDNPDMSRLQETIQRDVERSVQRAMDNVERSQAEAERARERSSREAERNRERSSREAERNREQARENAQREAERARRDAERQRENATRSRSSVETPRGPSTGFSYSLSTGNDRVTVSSSSGPGKWTEALNGWTQGVQNISRAINRSHNADELNILAQSVNAMSGALSGIEGAANAWAQSGTERRIVREAVQEARSELKDLKSELAEARAECE